MLGTRRPTMTDSPIITRHPRHLLNPQISVLREYLMQNAPTPGLQVLLPTRAYRPRNERQCPARADQAL